MILLNRPYGAAQTADKLSKRKNGCKNAAIFAFCVGVGCKIRSLTSV